MVLHTIQTNFTIYFTIYGCWLTNPNLSSFPTVSMSPRTSSFLVSNIWISYVTVQHEIVRHPIFQLKFLQFTIFKTPKPPQQQCLSILERRSP